MAVAAVVALVGFLMGFAQVPTPDLGPRNALMVGLGSATAWAMASACSSPAWNNWFNMFAAAFAALAVGYGTPGDTLCARANASTSDRIVWQGRSLALDLPCRMRGAEAPSGQETQTRLFVDAIRTLRDAGRARDGRITDLEAQIRSLKDAAPAK